MSFLLEVFFQAVVLSMHYQSCYFHTRMLIPQYHGKINSIAIDSNLLCSLMRRLRCKLHWQKQKICSWKVLVSSTQDVQPGKLKAEAFEPLVILCSKILIISKQCFNKDKKFYKSSKCLDNEAMLKQRVARDVFLFILSLLKSLMS